MKYCSQAQVITIGWKIWTKECLMSCNRKCRKYRHKVQSERFKLLGFRCSSECLCCFICPTQSRCIHFSNIIYVFFILCIYDFNTIYGCNIKHVYWLTWISATLWNQFSGKLISFSLPVPCLTRTSERHLLTSLCVSKRLILLLPMLLL